MKIKKKKTIGILGGMGAEASARLYQLLIEFARQELGAVKNSDFPEIVILSLPIPDEVVKEGGSKTGKKMINQGLERLKSSGAEILAVACNTAYAEVEDKTKLVSMIEVTSQEAVKKGFKRAGLLASLRTVESGLYQKAFKITKAELVVLNNQRMKKMNQVIRAIIAGEKTKSRQELLEMAEELVLKGAEVIILGCTDLGLVFPKKFKVPVIDSLEVLARSLLRRYDKNI